MANVEVSMKSGGPIGNGTATVDAKKITIKITKWLLSEPSRPDFLKSGKECLAEEGPKKIHKFKIDRWSGETLTGTITTPVIGANRG